MMRSPTPAAALLLLVCLAAGAVAQTSAPAAGAEATEPEPDPEPESAPASPAAVLATSGPDTLRTNLQVAEALMGEVMLAILPELPPPPAVIVLVPGSTEQAVELLTNVANHQLAGAGYTVHLEEAPPEPDGPVFEFRYRVENLALTYPDSGRRLLLWKSWTGRKMDLAVQVTVTDGEGQLLVSRRLAHAYQDRIPAGFEVAVESPTYAFTQATVQPGQSSRRLEQVVVLGTLAALVAVYFANTE